MPRPSISDVHVDKLLTSMSVAYIQSASMFIAARAFPVVSVEKKSDLYPIYDKSDWFRDEAQERAPGAESAGGGYRVTTAQYMCRRYSFHKDVDDETRANTDAPLNPDVDAMRFVNQKLLVRREKQWATNYFAAGIWTNQQQGVAAAPGANQFIQWDQALSDPISDVDEQRDAIVQLTGFLPNVLIAGPSTYRALKNNANILDRIKYTQRGMVTAALLAEVLELDEVLVPYGTEETAKIGATSAMAFMFGKHALLAYRPPNPGLYVPSAGYTFAWKGLYGANAAGGRIKRFRIEERESDRIEGDMAFDHKKVADDLGCFFKDAVA